MINVHTLYVYNTWSKDDMSIMDINYVIIHESEIVVKRIIDDYKPCSIDKFFEILQGIGIKYEAMVPLPLEV